MVKKIMVSTTLDDLFSSQQDKLNTSLGISRRATHHPVAKGNLSEANWVRMFDAYLPKRYRVAKCFVIDSRENVSDEIDLVIFDQQYSPLIFEDNGLLYVPAESVYAVFEIKPNLTKDYLIYAGKKLESVRKLYRTSVPIRNIYGLSKPKKLHNILGGILTLDSQWSPPFGRSFEQVIRELPVRQRIDLGCALQSGSFDIVYKKSSIAINTSGQQYSLMHFFLTLLRRLQDCGTVPAADFRAYERKISA